GTDTPQPIGENAGVGYPPQNKRPGVWVPAQGRDDEKNSYPFANLSKHASSFSRHDLPEVCKYSSPSKNQRAQGMPDARCTRGLVCMCTEKCAHEHTGQRRQSDIPCAMALRLITRSPR